MKTAFLKSFSRDLKKIKDPAVLDRVQTAIQAVETVERPGDITGLKKLSGSDGYYRLRIGDFRIGLRLEEETVIFVRCLNRRDLYRYFRSEEHTSELQSH